MDDTQKQGKNIFFWTSENQIFMRGSKEILGKKWICMNSFQFTDFLMELNGIWNGNKLWENIVSCWVVAGDLFVCFGRDGESWGVGWLPLGFSVPFAHGFWKNCGYKQSKLKFKSINLKTLPMYPPNEKQTSRFCIIFQ